MRLDSRPKPRERVIAQSAADTIVVLAPDSGEYYALSEVGARVWDLCDGTRTVAELVALLSEEYDAPRAAIESDVLELLTELAHEQLVCDAS